MPHYLHHHLKLHHLHFTEINELYISLSLQAFSLGLVGIFVPIYIYNLGYSAISLSIFFIITNLASIIIYPFSARMTNILGPKHIIAMSYIIIFIYNITLLLLPNLNLLFYPAAIIGGMGAGMFWIARHIDFATVISTRSTIKKFSNLLIFLALAQAFSPFIGGVIATNFGIQYGLLIACAGLIAAIYPLLRTPEPIIPKKTSIKIFRTAPLRHMIANFAMNGQTNVGLYTWSLFIFLVVNTYQNVGIISSASLFISILTLHTIGKSGNKKQSEHILKIGIGARSLVHFIRNFANTFSQTLGTNILGDLTDYLVSVPYASRFYNGARKYDISAYLTDMEIAGALGKILMWSILLIGSMLFDLRSGLYLTFLYAVVLMPLTHLIAPMKQEHAQT